LTSAIDRLGTDELANIFGFLRPKDIMRHRLNKKMKEAATQTTIVPVSETIENNAMATMTTALPNFQQISLHDLRLPRYNKYSDGDDPAEQSVAETANFISLDIQMLSNFGKLKTLEGPMYGDECVPFLHKAI
jgi:hypothetical protein